MIQFKSSTEEVKYTSDGFILSPRWVNICSYNFKIKFTTVALLLCVEGLGFLSTFSLGNTCSLCPCKNGTMCSWDTQAECQLEQSPRCSESLELRHLWSKALWMDGCISPDLLLRATLSRCILYSTHGKTQNKTARSQRVMSTPHTGVDSCVITQQLRLFSKLQKSWQ